MSKTQRGHGSTVYWDAKHSPRSRDVHDLPSVLVNNGPVSQRLLKVKLNANSADHTTSGRAGDGHRSDL